MDVEGTIEILDIEEEKEEDITTLLTKESVKREDALKSASLALENQSTHMIEYSKLRKTLKKLQKECLFIQKENQDLKDKIKKMNDESREKDEELVKLRLENEQSKKKRSALQSLLQVILNAYGVHEVIKILGIPYMKLREYLED